MVGVHLHKILESAKPSGGTGERQLPGEGGRVGDTRKLRGVMDMTSLDGDEAFMGARVRQISQTVRFRNVKLTVNYTSVKLLEKETL